MRLIVPPRLLVIAALAAAAVPVLVKRFKPAARVVADELIKAGENLRNAAKDADAPSRPEPDAKAQTATVQAPKPAASAPTKPKATTKPKVSASPPVKKANTKIAKASPKSGKSSKAV